MSEKKYCNRCDRTLPIENFSKDKKSKDGHSFYCKDCMSEYGKKYRNTPAGIYSNTKGKQKWCKENGDSRAKPFNISKEDFVKWHNSQPKFCVYCDIPEDKIPLFSEVYGGRDGRLSIDCKDNSLGYVKGNLVLACDTCNFLKSNVFSFEEMRELAQLFIKPKWQALTS